MRECEKEYLWMKPRDYAICFYLYQGKHEIIKGKKGHSHRETADHFKLSIHRIRQIHEKFRDVIRFYFTEEK